MMEWGTNRPEPDRHGEWRIFAAGVTGREHAVRQEPRQDRHGVLIRVDPVTGKRLLAIVVADGCGSARKAWAGAWSACRDSLRTIGQILAADRGHGLAFTSACWTDDVIRRLFLHAARGIERWSVALNAAPADLATTLNLAIVGEDFARFARVGDGILGYATDDAACRWQLAIPPDNGEFAGETTFLTSAGWFDRLGIKSLGWQPRQIFVASDGIGPILFDSRRATIHTRFMDPLIEALTRGDSEASDGDDRLSRFLTSDRVAGLCGDDLTLVIASGRGKRNEVDESGSAR